MKRSSLYVWAGIALVAVLAGCYGWSKYRAVFAPNTNGVQRVLLIPTGADLQQVMDSLATLDVLRDTAAFRWTAERKKYPSRIRPGRYVIGPGMSNNELVNKLRSGEQDPVHVTFTNIRTLPQLAGQVAAYLECDSLSLLAAMRTPAVHARYGFTEQTFISMFIPNTYEVWWTETPEAFLERMAREYKRFWTRERQEKAAACTLTQSEVSTLASIVQGETAKPDEASRIAGVYLNRLRLGMPLQADPTLIFALGGNGVRRVLNADRSIDSPYNTYLHTGLPPGPINLPEPRYIDAVLNAEKGDYLYFCARPDLSGYHDLAKTYDQHLVNARRYQRALNEQRIFR